MDVEVQAVPGCPGLARTFTRTRAALAHLGRADVEPRVTYIGTPDDAARAGFGGSPTIRVDGRDLWPGGVSGLLVCRLYRDGDAFADAPSQASITAALKSRLGG